MHGMMGNGERGCCFGNVDQALFDLCDDFCGDVSRRIWLRELVHYWAYG